MAKLSTLTQEEQDSIIYDARVGDLESLTIIFDTEVEPSLLLTIQDEYSLSTPFHMASANNHSKTLEYLISLVEKDEDKKTVLNKQNESGNTALHWASYNGLLDIVKILCENGADPFIRNQSNNDAIHEASNNDHEDVEDYLLEKYGNIVEEEVEGSDEEDASEDRIKFNEGTEIESVTEEARKIADAAAAEAQSAVSDAAKALEKVVL